MLPSIWRNNNSILSHSANDYFDSFFSAWPTFERDAEFKWSPRVDIRETDKEIILDFELPGIDKKDIKVEVIDNRISISGERKQEKKEENVESHRIERRYGKYERTFSLPDTIKNDKISAEYKDGILTVNLKKTEKVIPKEIAVEVK
ncbi:Hsp20/alpha crystallin family protein [Candidatus Latescibacterota bacterium]